MFRYTVTGPNWRRYIVKKYGVQLLLLCLPPGDMFSLNSMYFMTITMNKLHGLDGSLDERYFPL